jgi:hypothetical protein
VGRRAGPPRVGQRSHFVNRHRIRRMNLPTSHRIVLILLCIPLLCSGVFVAGHYYGQWQMDTARADLLEVATMLGYEPSAQLELTSLHSVPERHDVVRMGVMVGMCSNAC